MYLEQEITKNEPGDILALTDAELKWMYDKL